VECPKCGTVFERTIGVDVRYVRCPRCRAQLAVRRAAAGALAGYVLEIHVRGRGPERFPLPGEAAVLGSSPACDVVVADDARTVSRRHLGLRCTEGVLEVEDLGSRNGTYVGASRRRLTAGEPARLGPGDVIWAGPNVRIKIVRGDVRRVEGGDECDRGTVTRRLEISGAGALLVGRDPSADVVVDHPQVSRRHAVITRVQGGFEVRDLGSTNGTFVNGARVLKGFLREGDILGVGPVRLEVRAGGIIEEVEVEGGVRLDCRKLGFALPDGRVILRPLDLSILPGEFAGILGTSGSGKTTLLTLLNGSVVPTCGYVWMNGLELERNFGWLRLQVGYVPQRDIIHSELDVYSILSYAAKLRLEADLDEEDIDRQIGRVLSAVGMVDKYDSDFADLSGGEKKRINVAVELVTDPKMFFLDEPTSGLDPGTEGEVMRLFRGYARDGGKTVVMVTHVTENVRLMDKVALLAPGGTLAFFGAPEEALDYFGVKDFVGIYARLKDGDGDAWRSRYSASRYARRYAYVRERVGPEAPREERAGGGQASPAGRVRGWLRQLSLLSRRYARILTKERRHLAVLAVQAPVVGLLIAMVFGGVNRITAEAVPTREMLLEGVLFMLVLSALWFKTNNAAREISKERSVYKRERMVFLKLGPYVLSKFAVLAVLCLLQCSAMLLIVQAFLRLPGDFAQILQILVVLFLTALAGTAMGLLISALVRTSNVAVGLVPIVLIPQIIFGGLVRPAEDMGPVSRAVSRVMVAYWAYSAVREFSVGLPERGDVHDLNLEEPGVVEIGGRPRDIISAVKERFGLTRATPTDENLKRNSFIIFSFIPAFVLLSVIALRLKEREGFTTR